MEDFCLVLAPHANICADREWKEDDWTGVTCRVCARISFWAMPASALQYSTTELYASLRWVRPSRASYLTRVLHTSRINNFESVMWVKKNWTGENFWAGKWHKGANSSQSCSIDRKFDLLVNYTQFPASVTSELNYIITFYDIIITSRFGFSKEADLFKDLSLYV